MLACTPCHDGPCCQPVCLCLRLWALILTGISSCPPLFLLVVPSVRPRLVVRLHTSPLEKKRLHLSCAGEFNKPC